MATSSTSSSAVGAGAGTGPIVIATTGTNTTLKGLFDKYGLLCNSEGFYQHSTECWSDAIQMIMMYSDTIKDKVQPTLLFTNYSRDDINVKVGEYLNTKLKKLFPNITNATEYGKLYENNLTAVTKYYEAIQKRFQRHYVAEAERLEKFTSPKTLYERQNISIQCFDDLIDISKRFRSKNEKISNKPGPQAAIMGKSTTNILAINREEVGKSIPYKSTNKYKFTGFRSDIYNLINIYDLLFGLDNHYEAYEIQDYKFKAETTALYFSVKSWSRSTLHAICFYTCGGIDYFYNNERGTIAFPWRKFLTHYNELVEQKIPVRLYFGLSIFGLFSFNEKKYTKILDLNTYPYLYYNIKRKKTLITYLYDRQEPIEYTYENITNLQGSSVTVSIGPIDYTINFRERNPDFSVNEVIEILSQQTSTIENTEFTKSSGRFMRTRLIEENKIKYITKNGSTTNATTTNTTTSATTTSATSTGGKGRTFSKKRKINLRKSVTKRKK